MSLGFSCQASSFPRVPSRSRGLVVFSGARLLDHLLESVDSPQHIDRIAHPDSFQTSPTLLTPSESPASPRRDLHPAIAPRTSNTSRPSMATTRGFRLHQTYAPFHGPASRCQPVPNDLSYHGSHGLSPFCRFGIGRKIHSLHSAMSSPLRKTRSALQAETLAPDRNRLVRGHRCCTVQGLPRVKPAQTFEVSNQPGGSLRVYFTPTQGRLQ